MWLFIRLLIRLLRLVPFTRAVVAVGSAERGEDGEQISLRVASARFNPDWGGLSHGDLPRGGGTQTFPLPKTVVRRTDHILS